MFVKLMNFILLIVLFPIVFAYNMHRYMWNFVFEYVKATVAEFRTS